MKRFSYGERDYAFGQAMLSLRTSIGLTQAGLADLLRVSRRAVGEWEAGSSYPTAQHLQHVITLAVQQQVFAAGREEEEIRTLWHAAHQKVLLDEQWLSTLLGRSPVAPLPVAPVPAQPAVPVRAASGPRVEWGDALDMPSFYGREPELATLSRWVVQERCQVVSVVGLGGIGKSALVTSAMHQLADHFQVVIFRSLRDAPECSALLEGCLQVLAPESLAQAPQSLERRLSLLLEELRTSRVLLVLDNLESLLSEGEVRGHLRPGFEAYGRLLRQVAQTAHQSCLLLTSREKPAELRALEGSRTLVRALRLSRREPVTLEDLLAVLVAPLAHVQVLEAVDGLRRRSLIERGQRAGSFTLQSVVLEYVTTKLVTTASQEIGQGRLLRLREHGLSQAGAKEYVRQTQQRLLLAPLLARLQSMYQGRAEVEGQLRAVLDALRERAEDAQGYRSANLVALLRLLRGDLRGLDLSRLAIRGVY